MYNTKYALFVCKFLYFYLWIILFILCIHIHPTHLQNKIQTSQNIDTDKIKIHQDFFNFKHDLYNVSIPENSVGKTYASAAPHEDRLGITISSKVDIKYRIVSGDRDKLFKVEDRIVGDFAFLAIRTRTSNVILNREKTEDYYLIIKAHITFPGVSKNRTHESETLVHIKVLDRNDLSPLFYPTEYEKIISEDMPIHRSILRVTAEDADLGINGEIYYSFFNENENFAIHPTSGIISLTRKLNYSQTSRYELIVLANDRASAASHRSYQGTKARVVLKVERVNFYPPEMYVTIYSSSIQNSSSLIYGIIKVTDKDMGYNGEISKLEIIGGDPDCHFNIKPATKNEYFIVINKLALKEINHQLMYNLTLRAEDKGVPALSSYKIVPLNIFKENNTAPIFTKHLYEVSLPETSPPNTPVIRLKVTDPDLGKNALVLLEIVGGNEGGEFRIHPTTGMLYTNKILDAENKAFYTLTVSAIDQANVGVRKQSSAKVKINVEDMNDNDPIFEYVNTTFVMDENTHAGTVVVKLSAKDKDSGENSYISYSIANLNEVPFEIDHFTGVIRTTTLIDYETMRREYLLSVRASDWGLPYRRQTELELLIRVKDVNDNRPQFERINCFGKIHRNIPVGTDLFTLSAIDFDAEDFITYRIVSGNEDGCLNLDPTSGVISVGCDLNDVAISNRVVNFTSTDGTHFSDEMCMHLQLINEEDNNNDAAESAVNQNGYGSFECRETGVARRQAEILAVAEKTNMETSNKLPMAYFALMPSRYGENIHSPEFIDFPQELKLNESTQLGDTVIWIRAKDRDLGYNGKLAFAISDGDTDSVFRIDAESGELQIIGYLDRERQDEYILNVTVYDLGQPQKSTSKILPVTILDTNDNPPIFKKILASFQLPENAANGTIVFEFSAIDIDSGENARVEYALQTETFDFAINPLTGVLYVVNSLDREKTNYYELRIIAKDNGIPSLYSEAFIKIFIDDINDNAPKFIIDEFLFKAREDIPLGTVVASIQATDMDLGRNAEILFVLKEDLFDDGLFKIDKYTGIIRTQGYLDYETRQVHNLIVSAIDRGQPTLTTNVPVVIEIIDVNENRFAPEFSDFVYIGHILENQPKNTFVMNVNATDADLSGLDSKISYSIRGGNGMGLFAVSEGGTIRTLTEFDSETKDSYWLTLCAQDHAIVPLCSCVQIYINVKNMNDNVPLTDKPVYYASISEGSSPGVSIIELVAVDNDLDPNSKLNYKIIAGNPEGFFSIDSSTGIISTTARKLDRENQAEHILEVSVSDNGDPILSSTTRVIVSVEDINDHSPEFDQRFYKVQIPSTVAINASIFQVLAVDNDIGENGRITYSIKSGKGRSKFRIDPNTGIVYAAKLFEPDSEYDLTIRAEDNGTPKRSQAARLNIVVIPIMNHSINVPVIKSLDTVVDVTESDRPGFLVTLIQASDEDDDHLWYNIEAGDDNHEFYIGRDNGNILLSKSLDWEVKQNYNLTISVTDGIHTARTQLYVHVIDINDNRPQFTQAVYRIDISENIIEESVILQLHATDLDEEKKIFYTLHAARDPSSLALFRIDSLTGNVIVVQRLDREKVSEHVLIVTAKDQGTPANRNYAKIIIKVHDHNDHYPEFSSKIIQSKVLESSEIGSKVVQLFALDRDYGKNAEIIYSIVTGNIGNTFEIDSTMGLLTVAKRLDRSQMQEYMLQIKASDLGSPSLSSQIPLHIVITMAENDPPKFVSTNIVSEIYENIPIGSYVLQVEAVSSSSVFYEILCTENDDLFQINPSAGVIITKDVIDYECKRSFNLTIRATNMAAASSNTYVIIHVLDVNDNAPFFLESSYFGEISEAVEIGSLVSKLNEPSSPLLLKATDIDLGINGMIEYKIVDDVAKKYFSIDSSSGAVKVINSLDFELIPQFKFYVMVNDLGSPKLLGKIPTVVEIQIRNINDCPPIFKDEQQNATIFLPTYENVFVAQVEAIDLDNEESIAIRYDIIEGNSVNSFQIDSKSGIITTRNIEHLESSCTLHVRASDGLFSSVIQVYVSVETSENSGLVFQKSFYEFAVVENSTKVYTIGLVNVIGTNLNEHVEYRILNPTHMFKIGLTSGVIETTGVIFDREVQDNYKLVLEAKSLVFYETSTYVRRTHTIANIQILDINDNCPIFVNLPYYAIVSIDDLRGSVITKVHAVDLDSFENGEVRYEMKKGNGELFKMDRKTGELSLRQILEGHNRHYELIIAAYDGAITPCSTEVLVHIKVVDKSMPVFTKQFYSDVVNEKTELYTTLSLSIQAESPLKRKLIYTIIDGNDDETFEIDFITGAICVVNLLDYENKTSFELKVRATDSVSGIFADVPVSINIEDANDCYPDLESDIYEISMAENAIFGTQVLKINAYDNDTNGNGELSYFIESENGKNISTLFHLDMVEGIIYLKKGLDYEKEKLHHLVVVVSDHGTPSLSSTAHVWITVTDLNDNPPKFIEPSFTTKLSINAVRGQFVTITKAYDLDSSDITDLNYKIVNGNELQTYSIEESTGVIRLQNIQNFYDSHISVLNVSVTDGVYTSFARVKIILLPENIHSPIFSKILYEAKVIENEMPGTHVVTVLANDGDFDEFSKVTYTIISEEMKSYFTIEQNNGVIETKISFDREVRSEYDILISATDGGGKSGFSMVKVTITDINDNAPIFLMEEYRTTVKVNIKPNSIVLKVEAVDEDENQNGMIKYSIKNETLNPQFEEFLKINEVTGEISILNTTKKLNNELLQFFIRAYDSGIPPLYSDIPVSIQFVGEEVDVPTFEKTNINIYALESSSPGTVLTKFRLLGNVSIRFSIPMEITHFDITDAGELLLMQTLDREQADLHKIVVCAKTMTTPSLYTCVDVNIHVQDENDNNPIFEQSLYSIEIAENVDKMTSILKVTANDNDAGSNGVVRYYLADDANAIANVFDIDVYSGWITTLNFLDKETQSEYHFHVIAADNGHPKHVAKIPITIKLKDYNDNPPYFKKQLYEISVDENALPGTVLLHLSVTDLDEEQQILEYFIMEGDINAQFQIGETGELFVSKNLNREDKDFYKLVLLVTDGKFNAKTEVYVTVNDVNDNAPYCVVPRYKVNINESILVGAPIVKINAIDNDENGTQMLKYYLTGLGSDDFSIERETGLIKTSSIIDREVQSKYNIYAHVQDGQKLSWECVSEVQITVNDQNDNKPEFSMNQYIVSISEDAQVGTLVTKVHASDKDIGINRKVVYTFIESENSFHISKDNGIITLAKVLDRESVSMYNITVKSENVGTPSYFTTASLIINVLDINDNPPEFVMKQYVASIPENTEVNTKLLKVSATSKDTGVNAEISYFITGGNEQKKFSIDKSTGIVYVNGELDYEKTKGYLLTIQAVDGGIPPLSNMASINISVLDINDNQPIFVQNSYRAKIKEDINLNGKIVQVVATDEDSGQNSVIKYNIEKGDRENQFNIDSISGEITIASHLDREVISNYLLEVRACDCGEPQLCNYVHIHVDILDCNDNPPLFSKKNFSVFVQENRDLGYVILKFDINDADEYPNSFPYTFDFRSGNEGGFFRLEQDGTLRTAGKFNHRIRDSYRLHIRVFDNGTPPLFSDTWVNITIIEESQYPPIITPLEITVNSYDDEFSGGLLGRIFASDQDEYDTLYYDITAVAGETYLPNSLFNISHDSGTLFAINNLDVGLYKVNVTVTDRKFVSSAIIKINVELITLNMLQHSIVIQFSKITPEEFILRHRKGFIRSIRTAMRCRQKDVIIISVQISSKNQTIDVRSTNITFLDQQAHSDYNLDVLFTVRKQQVNPISEGYFTSNDIRAIVAENLDEIEEATNLIVEKIITTKCSIEDCVHGKCKDKIILNRNDFNTIYTDVISFVSLTYNLISECQCKQGYDGKSCDEPVNACFSDPCPPQKYCWPSQSSDGYQCICPHGYEGQFCEKEFQKCLNSTCLTEFPTVSFSGKSYAHYKINKSVAKNVIESQFVIFLRVRTLQQTGTLLYASGNIDYNVLEISNGAVQYKFDLGSGEGFVCVSSVNVSDGDWHSISLERILNSAKLIVDHKHVSQGSAPGVNGILNLQSNDIFIGAQVRPHPSVLGFEDIQRGFVGCMGDIRVSLEPLPLYISGGSSIAALKRFTNVEFTCNPSSVLIQLGVCGIQPCMNGGICIDLGNNNFKCQCHPRFNGEFCQFDLDPCASSPCLFGGRCESDNFGNYSCSCLMHLSGKRCEFGKFCNPNPCKNGGICEEGDGIPHCMCRGYTGPTCDIDVNECENQPCGNGATCINEAGSFRCICPSYLTGSSCGDPLYSNSITTKLKNLSLEHITGIVSGITIVFILIIIVLCIILCKSKKSRIRKHSSKDKCKAANLNSLLSKEYKQSSKLSNLEVNQRPISYTPTTNENNFTTHSMFVNNLDILRSYGSAGDELENIPFEYQKINRTNQQVNINACTHSDNESIQKQTWSDQMQLKTFSENKLNNVRVMDYSYSNRLASIKTNSNNSGKLIHVNMPNVCQLQNTTEYSPNNHGQYHWDCSDWVRKSQNPLPDITEVPGAEIADSSSFHSNESNESQVKVPNIVHNIGEVDPIRDITTLNEENTSEYNDSELESFIPQLPLPLERTNSISRLSQYNDSENEDFKLNTGELYLRHPNSYLPSFNIPSETEGETSLYIDKEIYERRKTNSTSEDRFGDNNPPNYTNVSDSDVSIQLCEIDDSEFDEFLPSRKSKHNA